MCVKRRVKERYLFKERTREPGAERKGEVEAKGDPTKIVGIGSTGACVAVVRVDSPPCRRLAIMNIKR